MATYTYAELRIPEASRLADLAGIAMDFEQASKYAERILAGFVEGAKPEFDLLEPYSIAIAIAYSRPFVSGVRSRLGDADIAILTPQERAAHDYLRDYRDKHVAHSVNSFEENVPRANYCLERVHEEGITGISFATSRVIGISRAALSNVVALCKKFGAHIDQLVSDEINRLLPIVRGMPIDEVLAIEESLFPANRPAIGKPRKSLRHR